MDPVTAIVRHSSERRSFVTRHIAGETLIVPVTGHVMDLESIYVLNPVGSRIWELLEAPTTAERIAETLAAEFAVTRERVSEDVREFIEALDSRGLIQAAANEA